MCYNRIVPSHKSQGAIQPDPKGTIIMADNAKNIFARRIPVSKPYLTTRLQALRLPASHFTQFMTESTVYGVIVDMPMGQNIITTLATYVNGAANLYFSNGGDYSGAAQRYPGVVQAARACVNFASQMIDENTPKADTLELPGGRLHFVYILTTGGIYRLELDHSAANTDPKERTFMNQYQRVLGELRAAQMKDQAAGIDPKKAAKLG